MDSKPRILVIDDDMNLRQTIMAILEEENYSTAGACNGEIALKHMLSQSVDLIIVDIIMPDKDGIEVIMEVKEKYPDTKILSLSGGGLIEADDHLKSALALGAHKTQVKPFKNSELVENVRFLLNN